MILDAKLTESKLRKTNEQIHYLGQYLSTKSIYGEFLKAPNKKLFRQAHLDELAQYEEALQILKQHSPDEKFPTMKDLRAEKEQLTIQKDAQYDTYHYFKDYHKELQTVCANVDSILGAEQEVQQHEQQHHGAGPHKAQLLADDGKDEIVLRLGHEQMLLAAVAQPQPCRPAGADGI